MFLNFLQKYTFSFIQQNFFAHVRFFFYFCSIKSRQDLRLFLVLKVDNHDVPHTFYW